MCALFEEPRCNFKFRLTPYYGQTGILGHFQICNTGRKRCFLTKETYKTTVNVVFTARLDYENCLLYGVAKHTSNFERIQPVQKHSSSSCYENIGQEHITLILADLHICVI